MAKPNTREVRDLTDSDINEQIKGTRRKLFDLRFQKATRQMNNPHLFKEARIKLAQLLTVQKERIRSTKSS